MPNLMLSGQPNTWQPRINPCVATVSAGPGTQDHGKRVELIYFLKHRKKRFGEAYRTAETDTNHPADNRVRDRCE